MAPAVALPEALKRANLTVDDISRFEVNEAFSVVVRVAEKLLQLDPAKVNVDGRVLLLVSISVAFLMSFLIVVPSHSDMRSETLALVLLCPSFTV